MTLSFPRCRPRFRAALPLVLLLLATQSRAQSPAPAETLPAPMLSRAATLALKVDRYDTARADVLQAAEEHNAAFLDAKTLVNEKGKKHGWLRLRVPSADLPTLLAALPVLGKTSAENVATTDERSEFEQLGRRVERLQQHEARLGGILESNRRMRGSDILFLQERLFRAGVDESLLSQQQIDLQRAAQNSTLLVELFEPGALPPGLPQPVSLPSWFGQAHAIAQSTRDHTLARAATASAYAAVYAPFWVPLLLVALVLLALLWHRRRVLWAKAGLLVVGVVTVVLRIVGWLRARWERRHEPIGMA